MYLDWNIRGAFSLQSASSAGLYINAAQHLFKAMMSVHFSAIKDVVLE